jgi:hypothetical protein
VSYLSRYQDGEHEQVWEELVALGSEVRSKRWFDEAQAVARETMRRISRNADVIVDRLVDQGYLFEMQEYSRQSTTNRARELIQDVEERVGPVPLSLSVCLMTVGTVDLRGEHPDWPVMLAEGRGWGPKLEGSFEQFVHERSYPVYADPLCIPPVEYLVSSLSEWDLDEHDDEWPARPFAFGFAPDELHKAGVSGGEPHTILLPDPGADPVLHHVAQRPGIRLVEYLRASCRWAGFPGYEFLDAPLPAVLEDLKTELLPI